MTSDRLSLAIPPDINSSGVALHTTP